MYSTHLKEKIKANLYQANSPMLIRIHTNTRPDLLKMYEEVKSSIPFPVESIQEAVYVVLNDIEEKPKCPTCGKDTPYWKIHNHYYLYCSKGCKSSWNKGLAPTEEHRKKISEANRGKVQSKEWVQKRVASKQGYVHSEETRKKIGFVTEGRLLSEEHKCKMSEAHKGDRHHYYGKHRSEEVKQKLRIVNLGKTMSEVSKRKLSKAMKGRSVSVETRRKMSVAASSPEVQEKMYQARKRNNSFTFSKEEKTVESLLRDIGFEVLTQYRSAPYPFKCDFYLPLLEMYIEYNGSWVHGKKPFNTEDPECQKKLSYWKERSAVSGFYRRAIHVWTISDPLKRQTAKQNNLHLIELWNMKEALAFVEEMKELKASLLSR